MPLLGGLAIPVNRFRVVLGDAFAVGVHHTEVVLRIRIPLLGKWLPEPKGFLVIASFVGGDRLDMLVLFLIGQYDYTCQCVDSALASPMLVALTSR